jgi:hypothetical protein
MSRPEIVSPDGLAKAPYDYAAIAPLGFPDQLVEIEAIALSTSG